MKALATLEPGETSVLELNITPIGASVGEAPRRVIAVGENVPREDVAGITDLVQRLHLTHGPYEIGYYLHAAPVPLNQDGVEEVSRENFIFQLFFDPNGNAVILINLNKDQRVMIQDRVMALSAPTTGVVMRHLQQAIVCVGSWTISLGERHILHLAILPRRYISMPETLSRIVRGAKRALEPSQPATEFKKRNKTTKSTKTANAANGSGATALFQTRAAEPLSSVPQSSTDLVQGSTVSMPLRHPLEMLQVGELVKVADASGGSYTLTRNANVMRNKNTLVFRAHYSSCSSVVVVKLIRTAKDSLDNIILKDLVRCAYNWTKEAMNHSKLNSYPAVARLLGIDGRFLLLYVEHVDSLNLAWYCEATANPYCTLTTRDAKRVLEDITGALHHIYSQNVIYNDIKPANILYSQDRGAVLFDFGLSAGHDTVHDGGSPWYVGPEYDSEGQCGAAGDVFALGVTLLFILGGIPLPELQTPPLQWLISDLRKKQATNKAKDTMLQWHSIIKKAVQQLQVTLDKEATKISDVVGKMLDFMPEQRATVDAIL
ncbi:kinase-like domain-containing protein [Trichoderma austrokoningii]